MQRWEEIRTFYESSDRPLIIDAGANIGAASVWLAATFPKAAITAIEPHPGNLEVLAKNVLGLNVQPLAGALARTSGRVSLFDPGQGEWAFRTGESAGSLLGDVQAFSIDELLTAGCTPFVLKIDIEGGELDLFEDASASYAQFPVPVIIELHDWMLSRSESSRSFLRWHASQNRDFIYVGENIFSLSKVSYPGQSTIFADFR